MDLKKVLGGFWRFTREIRSLNNDRQLIAQISNGKASYIAVPEVTTETSDEGNWMLYRETGDLVNYQFAGASGPVHRQYWHCVKERLCSQGKVFFAETKDSNHISVKDPWHECEVSQLAHNFKVANFFHDISMEPVEELDFETFAKQHPQYASEACLQFIKDNSLHKHVALCPHLCGSDYYSGVFAVETDNKFTTYWHIYGPQKDYTITTCYDRSTL